MLENEGILVKENHPVDLSQVAVMDSQPPDTPGIDRKRTTEMVANLLTRGEAHLETKQFADALDCFDLVLRLESKNRQAQLGRNQAYRRIIPRWHFEMLNDEKRNAAFEKVLTSAITPDTVVFDIGSGTGLLAMMAARAGAKETVTCEMVAPLAELTRDIVARNGLADRIVTLGKKSTSVVIGNQMKRKANLLVTETVDCGLLGEGIVPSIAHAKANLLTEDARIVPCGATVYAMVVESARLRNLNSAQTAANFDVSLINQYATAQYFPVRLAAFDYIPLTDPFKVFYFDFVNGSIVPDQKTISVNALRDGVGQCIIFWFSMDLDAETAISNEPGSNTHWEQALQCLESDVQLRAGEKLTIKAEHDCIAISFKIGE
ncbi:MAG TPA: 50S ribosomal protein L11 methyltransferase [Pyrinomonadaceae bacterium]|nr:50S ribosomal protein L11 methyltransferase [Pyrinomonadaceae bacterium]